MKRNIELILVIVASVYLSAFLIGKYSPGLPINSVVTQKDESFSVSGTGKVTVVPDTALVSLGVTASHGSVKSAQNDANTKINAITGAIKGLGVDAKDVKTENYSIYPQYDYQAGNRITGYQVNVSISVRIRDLGKVNDVIDTATAQGANAVGGIQLTVDEDKQKELRKEAREMAVKEAKDKASELARIAGITLGRVINVYEDSAVPTPNFYKEAALDVAGGRGGETNIEPGSTDITTSVTLVYETR